jgi:MFS family permease
MRVSMIPDQNPIIAGGSAVRFANIGHFYSHVVMLLYPTVVLALEVEFRLPYGELLALALPGFMLFGIAALPAGWLGDRWSIPGMLAIYFIGTGVAVILTGFADTPFEIGIGLTLIGLFASIYHPVGTSFVVRHAVNRARALGANGVYGTTGLALAALIAGTLTDAWGWRAAFFVPGAVCLATGIAFVVMLPPASFPRGKVASRLDPGVTRRLALRAFMVLGVTILCIGLIGQAIQVALPKVFAVRVSILGDAGLTGTAALVTAALMIAASGQFFGGILADRFPLKSVYITMYVLLVPVAVLAAGLTEAPLIAASAVLMLLVTTSLPAENCLVAKFCPAGWHATAYGAKFVLGLGIASLAVPLVGAVYDTTGSFTWFYVALGALGATVVAVATFLPGARATQAPPAPSAAPAAGAAE